MQTYKEMMFPILKLFSDRKKYSRNDVYQFITQHFSLSEQQMSEKIKSGQALYKDRANWAITYLSALNNMPEGKRLLSRVSRGIYQITELGFSISKDKKLFENWYQEIHSREAKFKNKKEIQVILQEKTPNERVDDIYLELITALKSNLLEEIHNKDSRFFENLVLQVLNKMGYGTNNYTSLTTKGADEGIDGIISEDELGLSKIYIQAKRWEGKVSRPEIQKFVGAISDKPTQKGVFITTSDFTREAIQYAQNIQNLVIILINGDQLSELMIKHKVGVYVKQAIELCEIDRDFFEE
ncbi:restriction endonuclease [Rodentibacter pneumotropicus]|uniref:restriction endonuclease n=2 Tax=Rodentibacter pneumotropicus TaxID=758 RepID=UPI00036C0539|nr:restriction endonuclease [Rodentibacter pneumotropicus]NBH74724.1 restriction endonuclease [Rodentibacter pneumotropicus]OOF64991.1 restriction endonuclease [Rodentibacter pneumotropicus]THA04169.1 restriction endonuclease [Rodentibacter pneumotropicus]THA09637.1 restriction endonuclease [Rodentibacter pneumotropicus]THA17666.1 restriction endonuclease [Rodentibacter pneumotropicus]